MVNNYIFSSNSARKYDYIYIITDMRKYRIIEIVKPCSHLSLTILKKNSILHVAGFLDLPLVIEKIDWVKDVLRDC